MVVRSERVSNSMKTVKDLLFAAEAFALQIPDDFASPQLVHEDDGDLSFEWYCDSANLIAVAVGPGHINWAGLRDGEAFHNHAKDLTPELLSRIRQVSDRISA